MVSSTQKLLVPFFYPKKFCLKNYSLNLNFLGSSSLLVVQLSRPRMFTGKTKLMKPFFSRPRTGFGLNQTDVKLHFANRSIKRQRFICLKNTNSCLDRTTWNIVTILMLPKLHNFRAKPRLNLNLNLFFEKFPILHRGGGLVRKNRKWLFNNFHILTLPKKYQQDYQFKPQGKMMGWPLSLPA